MILKSLMFNWEKIQFIQILSKLFGLIFEKHNTNINIHLLNDPPIKSERQRLSNDYKTGKITEDTKIIVLGLRPQFKCSLGEFSQRLSFSYRTCRTLVQPVTTLMGWGLFVFERSFIFTIYFGIQRKNIV